MDMRPERQKRMVAQSNIMEIEKTKNMFHKEKYTDTQSMDIPKVDNRWGRDYKEADHLQMQSDQTDCVLTK